MQTPAESSSEQRKLPPFGWRIYLSSIIVMTISALAFDVCCLWKIFPILLLLFLWPILVLLVTVVYMTYWLVTRWIGRQPRWDTWAKLFPGAAVSILLLFLCVYDNLPSTYFRNLVVSPVPKSVHAIRVGSDEALQIKEIVISFKALPEDMSLILGTEEFVEWDESRKVGAELYDLAEKHLGFDLKSLEPYRAYSFNYREDDFDGMADEDAVIVIDESRTQAVYFYLFYN